MNWILKMLTAQIVFPTRKLEQKNVSSYQKQQEQQRKPNKGNI